MSAKKMLFETLSDLSSEELKEFKSLIEVDRGFPPFSRPRLKVANTEILVELMVETYRQTCMETTKNILKKMNRTDLAQRLLDIIPGTKDKQRPSLTQRVETMMSDIELLLETLRDLSDREFEEFKKILRQIHSERRYSNIPWTQLEITDMQDTVFLMVQSDGQKSVETANEVLKKMERTDLIQRLSDSSSGSKKKPFVDEYLSALIHKVATLASGKDLLFETLNDLSYEELKTFKWLLQFTLFKRNLPHMSWGQLKWAYRAELLVNVMVRKYGQKSVDVTKEVFMDMNRMDLVQRLSETSSGPKAAGSSAEAFDVNTMEREKYSVDERWPALIQKVEMILSVIELLLETLTDLNDEELKKFKYILLMQTHFRECYLNIPWRPEEITNIEDIVFLIVQNDSQPSVETTKGVLKTMKKTDLVQRLSDSSSGPKEKTSTDEPHSAVIQSIATMVAVKQLILETLNDLSNKELETFKEFLQLIFYRKDLPRVLRDTADRAQLVEQMVETYGQQTVELIREVFMDMNRTDLAQKLSKPSSGLEEKHSVDEHRSALLERTAAIAAVLSETLSNLSDNEFKKFKCLLQFMHFQKSLPQFSWSQMEWADSAEKLVDLMVVTYRQQSVEVTKEVLMDMSRTDLVQRLSESSSGLKEKHESEPLKKEATMTSLKEKLLETLEGLIYTELEQFKWLLQDTETKKGLLRIPRHRVEIAGRVEIVELMVEIYGQQSVEVMREVLEKMSRNDLLQRLSDINPGSKEEPPRSVELEGCGSIMQDSSDWTKLEPEVNSTDADEAPAYSLQTKAGKFECSVSGLRWFCKEKVNFKYQFCSWEEHIERMESIQYMPAGPLIDITVIAGRLDEVYLPHWICIDDNPAILDKFAVLHINDCGDEVEKVSEVTPSHVKLSEPVFSPRAVLMKTGIPVKVNCNVLIYKTNTAFLTLHVYLIPRDPGLQQVMDKRELSYGYKVIRKPPPEKSLKVRNRFILTADLDGAEIYPEKLKFRNKGADSHFFEVFIDNPDTNFKLQLKQEKDLQPVWTGAIRKDEYKSTGHVQDAAPVNPPSVLPSPTQLSAEREGEHFVDKHQCDLIERVSNIGPILDNLLKERVIQQQDYDTIRAIPITQEKMRTLYSGPLKAGGHAAKDIFYSILKEKELYLVNDLMKLS
ncbi:NACHT, LRR and PYD domains-containing protein 1 homolog [Dicentrarchus labrax]|uniref:NACHT, LRR and PYD domains-containing protein 1 homolog n=1 Tax=Dicentrarchus labrax TaxID=13489 RepID=UPI0021F59B76|nr:NACHT, LRR and PYD domains-containing protein 1 homolog [Dicentrarchus labrax]